jgi:hypothetical protein
MLVRQAALIVLCAAMAAAAEVKGTVKDAVGGETLAQIQVSILEAGRAVVTGSDGVFIFQGLPAGSYTLRLSAVGYRLSTTAFSVTSNESKEFALAMVPDNFRHTETVRVTADVFQREDSPAVLESNLTASEIREASTVFADDPFRAIQALPGVSASANNELYAQFSVMGTPFQNVSIYLDDVLTSPFHSIPDISNGASLSMLTSETVEEMKLMPVAYPVQFGDGIGAALDIRTRDGSSDESRFRASAGIADSDILGEGPLGAAKHGSWIASARKSYIGWLIRGRENNVHDVTFYDGDAKLVYDLTRKQTVSFHALGGQTYTALDPSSSPDAFETGNSSFTFARAGWRWTATPHLLLDSHAAYFSEPYDSHNSFGQILDTYAYGEWVGGSNLTWAWRNNFVIDGGATLRRLRDSGYAIFPGSGVTYGTLVNSTGLRGGIYLQQSASAWKNRLHLTTGVRWDDMQRIGVRPFSEQVAIALKAAPNTELQFAAGRYAQLPDFQQVANFCTGLTYLLERSDHYTAGVEQRITESTRLRVQAFERRNADLAGTPSELLTASSPANCGVLVPVPGNSAYQRDYSHGVQIVLQRRSANRLSGWMGYTFSNSYERLSQIDLFGEFAYSTNTPYFPTLQDQHNSFNAFGSYRLTPSVNLSGKILYGSGYPIPSGSFLEIGNILEGAGPNTVRLPAYLRFDLRADKSWTLKQGKLSLYGEILNLTNHYNRIYAYSTILNPDTLQVTVITQQELPITPTAGLVFEF